MQELNVGPGTDIQRAVQDEDSAIQRDHANLPEEVAQLPGTANIALAEPQHPSLTTGARKIVTEEGTNLSLSAGTTNIDTEKVEQRSSTTTAAAHIMKREAKQPPLPESAVVNIGITTAAVVSLPFYLFQTGINY